MSNEPLIEMHFEIQNIAAVLSAKRERAQELRKLAAELFDTGQDKAAMWKKGMAAGYDDLCAIIEKIIGPAVDAEAERFQHKLRMDDLAREEKLEE